MILELRYSVSFHLLDHRFGTNSFKFKGSLLWNSLIDKIKTAKSLAIFKTKNQIVRWQCRDGLFVYLFYLASLLFSM